MAFSPLDFAYQRFKGIQGYSNPDDPGVKIYLIFFYMIFLVGYAHGYVHTDIKNTI